MQVFFLLSLLAFVALPGAAAQTRPVPTEVPLLVSIVVARGGEEHTYDMYVTANRPPSTELRQGREIAIEGDSKPTYRNVGTNIQCRASTRGDGFLLWLALEKSSIAESAGGHPSFHTFNTTSEVLLSPDEEVSLVTSSDDEWTVKARLHVLE